MEDFFNYAEYIIENSILKEKEKNKLLRFIEMVKIDVEDAQKSEKLHNRQKNCFYKAYQDCVMHACICCGIKDIREQMSKHFNEQCDEYHCVLPFLNKHRFEKTTHNGFVFGISSKKKDCVCKYEIEELLKDGVHVVVLDTSVDYENFCYENEGQHIGVTKERSQFEELDNNRLLIFDMADICCDKDATPVCLPIFKQCLDIITGNYENGIRTVIYARNISMILYKSKEVLFRFGEICKIAKKYGSGVTCAEVSIEDWLKNPAMRSILCNASHVCILSASESDKQLYKQAFDLTDGQLLYADKDAPLGCGLVIDDGKIAEIC